MCYIDDLIKKFQFLFNKYGFVLVERKGPENEPFGSSYMVLYSGNIGMRFVKDVREDVESVDFALIKKTGDWTEPEPSISQPDWYFGIWLLRILPGFKGDTDVILFDSWLKILDLHMESIIEMFNEENQERTMYCLYREWHRAIHPPKNDVQKVGEVARIDNLRLRVEYGSLRSCQLPANILFFRFVRS